MKIVKIALTSFLCSSLLMLSACSTPADPSEAYKGESANQIFNQGETATRNGNFGEAIKRYEALTIQYPYDSHAETAQLHIIYAYYKNSDYLAAEAAADRFIQAYPASHYVDYAYFMRGKANFNQNLGIFERLFNVDYATRDLAQVKKSYDNFAILYQRFPESRYAPAAHQYMIYLRNIMANHQLEVAQFYYTRKAYVASANRANIVVRHYQESPAVPKALVMMVKSYRQLHMMKAAKDAFTVLQYNYPNSDYVQQALNN